MSPTKDQLFSRQITLGELGQSGQQKLQNTSVLVVGCGGLGSPIAVHLAASGIGHIHLVDFDIIDASNLHRQVYYALEDVGKLKAVTLAEFIQKRAPFTKVSFSTEPVTKDNVFTQIEVVDIVVDGTDSLPTKYLLNDACVLKDKPLVYGSLYKFDGYVASFNITQEDNSFTANLRDAFPKMATNVPNCEEAGTLNPIVSLIAAQQANEVLKLATGIGNLLVNELLIYNALQNTQLKMKLQSVVSKEEIQQVFDYESYLDESCQVQHAAWLISSEELKQELLAKPDNLQIIGVLEGLSTSFKIDKTYTLTALKGGDFVPVPTKKYVLVCKKGITSYAATQILRQRFPTVHIFSLAGGVNSY